MIDRALLLSLLDYEPDTGLFRWKKDRTAGVKAGHVAGAFDKDGYVVISILAKQYRAHRLAWFIIHNEWSLIDHKDGNPTNNRLGNLRPATHAQNCANRRGSGKYLKGVQYTPKKNIWGARICKDGNSVWLGSFKTEEEAHAAYCAAAIALNGDFAKPALTMAALAKRMDERAGVA